MFLKLYVKRCWFVGYVIVHIEMLSSSVRSQFLSSHFALCTGYLKIASYLELRYMADLSGLRSISLD